MARETTIAIALAILLSLGGCSGLLPDSGPPEEPTTPFGPESYDLAVANHAESLRDAGQFKLRSERSVTFPDRVVNRSPGATEMVADFDADQYLMGQELEGHNGVYQDGAAYQNGTTTWTRRQLDNGSMVYRRVPPDSGFSVQKFILPEIWAMENHSKKFPLERNGTAIFQGRRVTRYTADELGSAERCLFDSRYVIENVTSVEVVALVDNRGIIRKFECTLSGETNIGERFTERRLWTITMIGVVEIREPAPLVNETRGG